MWTDKKVLEFMRVPIYRIINSQAGKHKELGVWVDETDYKRLSIIKDEYGISTSGILRVGMRLIFHSLNIK